MEHPLAKQGRQNARRVLPLVLGRLLLFVGRVAASPRSPPEPAQRIIFIREGVCSLSLKTSGRGDFWSSTNSYKGDYSHEHE